MKKIYSKLAMGIWLALNGIGLLGSQLAGAQAIPDIQWTRPGLSLAVTTDGSIITTQTIVQPTQSGLNRVGDGVVKYGVSGNGIWATGLLEGGFYIGGQIQGYNYEVLSNIRLAAPTTDGGVGVVGNTSLRGLAVATKIAANGTPRIWQDTDFITHAGNFEDLIGTPDGGFLLLTTRAIPDATTDVTVHKYDASGNFSWFKPVAYPTPDPATPDRSVTKGEAIINTPDGGYLVVGYYNTTGRINDQNNSSIGDNTGWVAKLDSQGNVVWQKLLSGLPLTTTGNGFASGSIVKMLSVTDVIRAADGVGYALVGPGLNTVATLTTALLELDEAGNFKRARSLDAAPTDAFIALYAGTGATTGTSYYAVGNTSLTNGADPQILKVSTANVGLSDPALFSVVARRTFDSPSDSYLRDINVAGDGHLVFLAGGQVVKLNADPLIMTAPTYNCQTGAIVFNTTGGNGSPITYLAPGITRSSVTDNFGTVELGLRGDPKVISITAEQGGVSVTYSFDLKTACTPTPPVLTGPIPDQFFTVGQPVYFNVGQYFHDPTTIGAPTYMPNWSYTITSLPTGLYDFSRGLDLSQLYDLPVVILGAPTTPGFYTVLITARTGAFPNNPVSATFHITVSFPNPPPGTALTLIAPTYDCATGAFTFRTTGGDGSLIEYQAPGITGWTSNPNQFVDKESRTASDVRPFQLMARQNGVVVTLTWDLKAACGRARMAAGDPAAGLQVRILGNPVVGQTAQLEITGVSGQRVQFDLIDNQGRTLHQHAIGQAAPFEQVSIPIGRSSGLFFLRVQTASEHQTVKLVKP